MADDQGLRSTPPDECETCGNPEGVSCDECALEEHLGDIERAERVREEDVFLYTVPLRDGEDRMTDQGLQATQEEVDALLGKTRFLVPPETMSRQALEQIAYAAQSCLEQWAQGRGTPPRMTGEERTLRDRLGVNLEIFGD